MTDEFTSPAPSVLVCNQEGCSAPAVHVYEWRCHTAKAPYESEQWATTDRGWLFHTYPAPPSRPYEDTVTEMLGHYLDYGPCGEHYRARPEGSVHAVSCATRSSQWFRTPLEAIAWIEEQAKVPQRTLVA